MAGQYYSADCTYGDCTYAGSTTSSIVLSVGSASTITAGVTPACAGTTAWLVWGGDATARGHTGTWELWTTASPDTYISSVIPSVVIPLTTEELVAERARTAARREKERAATEKALALLHSVLDEQQRAELEKDKRFTVRSRSSQRRYRISVGTRHGNIKEVNEKGEELRSLCCAPEGNLPEADAIVGQALFLEHAEEEFLRRANVTELRRAA